MFEPSHARKLQSHNCILMIMTTLRRVFCKSFVLSLHRQSFKSLSTSRENPILVYRSVSKDPYVNLAFEDWMYENLSFEFHKCVLFLWRNDPTVVIGRHQNPWSECNLQLLKSQGINLVRRKSGGGAVYHDHGNINCTFFTDRDAYDRKNNLECLARFLKDTYKFNVSLNERDDLILDAKYKISGTAAKLGLKRAYHHCTLLCNVDSEKLNKVLLPSYSGIFSNATKSVRSKTKNLFDDSVYDWQKISCKLAKFFITGNELSKDDINWSEHLLDIDPILHEKSAEISSKRYELLDWEWNYGKTPKFTFTMESNLSFGTVKIEVMISKGVIVDSIVECGNDKNTMIVMNLIKELTGVRFERSDILMTICDCLSTNVFMNDSYQGPILREVSEFITSALH